MPTIGNTHLLYVIFPLFLHTGGIDNLVSIPIMTVFPTMQKVCPSQLIVERELPTLPEHPSSSPVFSGIRVTRSLVLCVMFCRSLPAPFSFGHCVVCPSSIYEYWLPPFDIFKLVLFCTFVTDMVYLLQKLTVLR